MFVKDGLTVDKTWETPDGFLGFSARFAKTGIQHYLGDEIDPEGRYVTADGKRRFEPGKLYPVNRPSREVFSDRAMGSFIAKPITNDHPSAGVNVENWKDLAKGAIGEVLRDGQYARMSGLITDKATIADYRAGKKQLSGGYATELVVADGVNEFGDAFVAEQTAIDGNHCALVKAGRAGPACAISDSVALCDANPAALADFSTKETTMKIKIGDAEVDATNGEAVRIAVDALNTKLSDGVKALADATSKAVADAAAIVAKDAEIADLKAKLEAAAITPQKLADAAKEYADVQAKAKAVGVTVAADADTAAIKKAVVDAKMGDAAKDYTADHIAIAFDALTKDAKVEANDGVQPLGSPQIANDADKIVTDARDKMIADMKAGGAVAAAA
jgi:hypothetical protein